MPPVILQHACAPEMKDTGEVPECAQEAGRAEGNPCGKCRKCLVTHATHEVKRRGA